MDIELFSFVTNMSVLTLAGLLYAVYIKNLRSMLVLKDEQLKLSEQNLKVWKDKVLELERQSPQFLEKLLSDRIQVREDEISRLAEDGESHRTEINKKNSELDKLRSELQTTQEFGRSISVYDRETNEYRTVSPSELTLKELGSFWVDSATLMICDPWHLKRRREIEIEEHTVLEHRFRDLKTEEEFCFSTLNDEIIVEGLDGQHTIKELVRMNRFEEIPQSGDLPAIPNSYIKGENISFKHHGIVHALTFYNGDPYAGLTIGLGADGFYTVRGEIYKGNIQRIMIDLLL